MNRLMTYPGKYKTRVTFRNPTRAANNLNEQVPAYTELYCKRWAYVVPSSAREFVQAQQVEGLVSMIMRVRSDSQTRAITSDMRIEIGSRVVNIGGVYDETEARQEVVLWCTEVVS